MRGASVGGAGGVGGEVEKEADGIIIEHGGGDTQRVDDNIMLRRAFAGRRSSRVKERDLVIMH